MLPNRLKKAIDSSGETIPDIAKQMGLSTQQLYKIIKNPKIIRVEQIQTLSKATEIEIGKLFRIILKQS